MNFRHKSLAAALLATSAISSPALADNPRHRNWDENGVDLVRGDYRFNFAEGSIGNGKAELSLVRVNNADAFSQWDLFTFSQSSTGSDVFTRVGMTNGSDKLFGNGESSDEDGSFLLTTGTLVTYNGADGTTIDYFNPVAVEGPGTEFCSGANFPCKLLPQAIRFPDERTITFAWTVVGSGTNHSVRLESVTSNYGYSIAFNYQSSTPGTPGWSRRASSVFKNGATAVRTINYAYPVAGTTDITDATNNVWRVTGKSIRRPGEATPALSYSATSGVVTSVTANGVTTSYARSVNGNTVTLTKTTAGDSTVITGDLAIDRIKSITNAVGKTTTFTHDAVSRLTKITAPEGNSVEYALDGRGNPSITRFRPKTGSSSPALDYSAVFAATCTNEYTCNQATSIQEPGGIPYTYNYGIKGQINSATAPAVNGVAGQTRWSRQIVNGIRELRTESICQTANLNACVGAADEIKTTYTFGANGNLANVTTANGTGTLSASQTMTHNTSGDVLTVDGPLAGTADMTTYRYDAMRRLVGVIDPDPDGGGAAKQRAVRYTYDASGRVTLEEVGTVTAPTDPGWAGFVTAFQQSSLYDTNNRIIRQKLTGGGADRSIVDYVYDTKGRLSCTVTHMNAGQWGTQATSCAPLQTNGPDGPDRVVQLIYDAADRVTELRLAVGTSAAATERTLAYTDNGQVRTLKDGENNLSTYSYDEYDRFSKLEYPMPTKGANASNPNDYEQFTYDSRSNVTSQRLRDGTNIAYTIDPLNRISFKNLPGIDPDVTYTYDNQSKLRTAARTGYTLTLGYDGLGRQNSDTQPIGSITRQFDLAGKMTKTTWWDGFFVDYDRLVTGEIDRIRENGASSGIGVLADFSYDDLRRRTGTAFGNGMNDSYAYDSVSRLSSRTINLTGTGHDLTQDYSYNPAHQIKQVIRSNDIYAFTGFVSGTTASTSDGLNRIASIGGGGTPAYDTRGNLTSDPTTGKTLTYSSENQLKTASGGVTINYDPIGRISEYNAPASTRFVHDGIEVASGIDGSGGIQHRYVRGDGADELLVVYSSSSPTSRRWYVTDERGSILGQADSSGTLQALNRYDEFGTPQTGNTGFFQYTGQMWLPAVGAYHYKMRTYSPTFGGRYYQTDPIGYSAGPNLYAYVGNDPINLIDPLGLTPTLCGAKATDKKEDVPLGPCPTPMTPVLPLEWQFLDDATVEALGGQGIHEVAAVDERPCNQFQRAAEKISDLAGVASDATADLSIVTLVGAGGALTTGNAPAAATLGGFSAHFAKQSTFWGILSESADYASGNYSKALGERIQGALVDQFLRRAPKHLRDKISGAVNDASQVSRCMEPSG